MAENTTLWDKLGKTDPAHTKGFTRAGGFKGTAIKPMFSYRRMTEEFGPCGSGWGINEPSFQVVPAGDEILVYCTVSIWYGVGERRPVFGVGGDKVATKGKDGVRTDDEAFKKAFTDAVTNALKLIGVGADVHMGMFDDSKYVNTIAGEFKAEKAANDEKKPSAAHQRRELDLLKTELLDTRSTVGLTKLFNAWKAKAHEENWSPDWWNAARDLFAKRGEELKAQQEDTVTDIQQQFGGKVVNEHVREQSYLEAGE